PRRSSDLLKSPNDSLTELIDILKEARDKRGSEGNEWFESQGDAFESEMYSLKTYRSSPGFGLSEMNSAKWRVAAQLRQLHAQREKGDKTMAETEPSEAGGKDDEKSKHKHKHK